MFWFVLCDLFSKFNRLNWAKAMKYQVLSGVITEDGKHLISLADSDLLKSLITANILCILDYWQKVATISWWSELLLFFSPCSDLIILLHRASNFILALYKTGYTFWRICRVESSQGGLCNRFWVNYIKKGYTFHPEMIPPCKSSKMCNRFSLQLTCKLCH